MLCRVRERRCARIARVVARVSSSLTSSSSSSCVVARTASRGRRTASPRVSVGKRSQIWRVFLSGVCVYPLDGVHTPVHVGPRRRAVERVQTVGARHSEARTRGRRRRRRRRGRRRVVVVTTTTLETTRDARWSDDDAHGVVVVVVVVVVDVARKARGDNNARETRANHE